MQMESDEGTRGEMKIPDENSARNKIGPYTRAKTEKGNGTCLARICHKQQMKPMETWKVPEQERQDSWGNINTMKIRRRKDGKKKWETNTYQHGLAQTGN